MPSFRAASCLQMFPPKPCAHFSSMRATRPVHLILFNLTILMISDVYKLWRFSLWNVPQPHVFSSFSLRTDHVPHQYKMEGKLLLLPLQSLVTLASSNTVLHSSRSCYLRLQFSMSMFFRSYSTDSSHLTLSFPTLWVPSGLTFKRRIKSRLQFAGVIRISPYSTRFQDKG